MKFLTHLTVKRTITLFVLIAFSILHNKIYAKNPTNKTLNEQNNLLCSELHSSINRKLVETIWTIDNATSGEGEENLIFTISNNLITKRDIALNKTKLMNVRYIKNGFTETNLYYESFFTDHEKPFTTIHTITIFYLGKEVK